MKITNLRVLSGNLKGKTLKAPGAETHPMGSREKLALFNILHSVNTEKVLDIYAGSGALGIEAASRWGSDVTFVEKSPKVAKILQQNLTNCKLDYPIFTESARKFSDRPEFQNHFGLILADPPYDDIDLSELSKLTNLLAPQGTLALSYPANLEPPALPGLELLSRHTYAKACLIIFKIN